MQQLLSYNRLILVLFCKLVFGGDVQVSEDWIDVHIVAGSIKSYLKELPKPLVPWKQFKSFTNVVASMLYSLSVGIPPGYVICMVLKILFSINYEFLLSN